MRYKQLTEKEIKEINIAGLSDRQLKELQTELLRRLLFKEKGRNIKEK